MDQCADATSMPWRAQEARRQHTSLKFRPCGRGRAGRLIEVDVHKRMPPEDTWIMLPLQPPRTYYHPNSNMETESKQNPASIRRVSGRTGASTSSPHTSGVCLSHLPRPSTFRHPLTSSGTERRERKVPNSIVNRTVPTGLSG